MDAFIRFSNERFSANGFHAPGSDHIEFGVDDSWCAPGDPPDISLNRKDIEDLIIYLQSWRDLLYELERLGELSEP